jgi:hypothetical protein
MKNKETIEQAHQYIGECKGNEGNGCFLDSAGHNCGCFKKAPKETKQMYSEEDMLRFTEWISDNDWVYLPSKNYWANEEEEESEKFFSTKELFSEWFQKYKK